jgi:hypothetical protein
MSLNAAKPPNVFSLGRVAGGSVGAHRWGFGPPLDYRCRKSLPVKLLRVRGAWSRGWTNWTPWQSLNLRAEQRFRVTETHGCSFKMVSLQGIQGA